MASTPQMGHSGRVGSAKGDPPREGHAPPGLKKPAQEGCVTEKPSTCQARGKSGGRITPAPLSAPAPFCPAAASHWLSLPGSHPVMGPGRCPSCRAEPAQPGSGGSHKASPVVFPEPMTSATCNDEFLRGFSYRQGGSLGGRGRRDGGVVAEIMDKRSLVSKRGASCTCPPTRKGVLTCAGTDPKKRVYKEQDFLWKNIQFAPAVEAYTVRETQGRRPSLLAQPFETRCFKLKGTIRLCVFQGLSL